MISLIGCTIAPLVAVSHAAKRTHYVYDLTGKAWRRAIREEYLPRDTGAENFSLFFWDGTTTAGNKTYRLPTASTS